ncbi:MAG: hypothetical protein ACYDD5_00490 [Sulfuricurvum sp.]
MKYSFTLYDPVSKITVVYKDHFDWKSESNMLFQWLENNYSCDCNRDLFMYGHDSGRPCGEDIQLLEIRNEHGDLVPMHT